MRKGNHRDCGVERTKKIEEKKMKKKRRRKEEEKKSLFLWCCADKGGIHKLQGGALDPKQRAAKKRKILLGLVLVWVQEVSEYGSLYGSQL